MFESTWFGVLLILPFFGVILYFSLSLAHLIIKHEGWKAFFRGLGLLGLWVGVIVLFNVGLDIIISNYIK